MFDMENIGRVHDDNNLVLELTGTARHMIKCESEVIKAIEMIIESFDTQGTKGADHKPVLQTKISGLKRLAQLYRSMAEKYTYLATELASGASEGEVTAELSLYNVFINDQMDAERECYDQALNMLKD